MRIAALYDIHANLPALEAVLAEVQAASVDAIVIGGDVLPGPMPQETLDALLGLRVPTHWIHGNGDLAVLAQIGVDPESVTYWGTTGGVALPEPFRNVIRWTSRQLDDRAIRAVRSWPATLRLAIPWVGDVLFCHATPRSETDCFTRLTSEERLRPLFDEADADLVICGHTHMPFDRAIGGTRVVNAGSVGMPFGRTGADWLLLGPDVELRHTDCDLERAASLVRATAYPQAESTAAHFILTSPSEEQMLAAFTEVSFGTG